MATPVVSNLISGPAIVYYAPEGESVPADSVAAGTTWGGNWTRVGYTKAPLTMTYEAEQMDLEVEETLTAVRRVKTSENLTLETTLAEITSTYLSLAVGGTASTTAAGAGQVGKDELVVGGVATETVRAWGFEGTYVNNSGTSYPLRVFVYRATAIINGALEFAKASSPGITLQIKALADTGKTAGQQLFKLQRVTASATS